MHTLACKDNLTGLIFGLILLKILPIMHLPPKIFVEKYHVMIVVQSADHYCRSCFIMIAVMQSCYNFLK